jgi:hypothetical protein
MDVLRGMGLLGLWPLCVFGCISVVVVGGICVRDCRGLELCAVGTVGQSAGGEYVGGMGSVVTDWWRMGGRGDGRGMSAWEGAERAYGRENNGL